MTGPDQRDDERDLAGEVARALASGRPRDEAVRRPGAAGWQRVRIAAAVVLILATLLAAWAITSEPTGKDCHEDEGWAYYLLFFTPLVALVSAGAMAIVAGRAIGWDRWRGPFTTGRLLVLAVLLSLVAAFAAGIALEGACIVSNVPYGASTLILPAAIGVAVVLIPAWVRRHLG
jgi:hypothetical protein